MIKKTKLIEYLEGEYWTPMVHPTNTELDASYRLTDTLDEVIQFLEDKGSLFGFNFKLPTAILLDQSRSREFETSDEFLVNELYDSIIKDILERLWKL